VKWHEELEEKEDMDTKKVDWQKKNNYSMISVAFFSEAV